MNKILVIDDSAPIRLICNRALSKQGYQVIEAENGAMGCRLAASDRPDLVLLDVMMPKMDGFEVLERLKADPATSSLPVIMLTSRDEVEDLASALELGVAGYIIKPVAPDDLCNSVRQVLGACLT